MLLGDHFFSSNESQTTFIWHSSCSKIPILWEELNYSIHYYVRVVSCFLIVFITVGTQIAVFKRKWRLEQQRADGIMVITYDRDGVTISRRGPDVQSSHKLWKHNRTVVTPNASFLSFLLSVITLSSHFYFFFNVGPSGPLICGEFIFVLIFCMLFFVFSFIEAIFSPTLCNTLFCVFPCRKYKCHVVNI